MVINIFNLAACIISTENASSLMHQSIKEKNEKVYMHVLKEMQVAF